MLKLAFEKLFQARRPSQRPGADDGFDAYEKPFLDHLEDLRVTLFKVGAVLAVTTICAFTFHQQIFELLLQPAKMIEVADGVSLYERTDFMTLKPQEIIILMLKVSFFAAVIVSFPFSVYFLFEFILPGMRQMEKKTVIPGVVVGFFLFLIGVSFAFYFAAPIALQFFYKFENSLISSMNPAEEALEKDLQRLTLLGLDGQEILPIEEGKEAKTTAETSESALDGPTKAAVRDYMMSLLATPVSSGHVFRYDEGRDKIVMLKSKGATGVYQIGEYINFITRLVLVFGISFQLPVVVTILTKLELLTARVMRATRTYAWIVILVAAAILTPPDLITLTMLGGPMIFLYEVCIIIATVIEKRREKANMTEEEKKQRRLEQLYLKPADELTEEEKEELHQEQIAQYEREHAHMFDEESDHHHHEDIDEHYGHELPHHVESQSSDGQDQSDPDESGRSAGMERGHFYSETDPDSAATEEEPLEGGRDELTASDDDDEPCQPSGPIVDLNHATEEELLSLPGIEPYDVEMIIGHRPFHSFDELEDLGGLSTEQVNKIVDRIMLG